MSRLQTPQAIVETALKARSEGLGVRATARVLNKSHNSIGKWESRLAAQESKWSATPSAETDVEARQCLARLALFAGRLRPAKSLARGTRGSHEGQRLTGKSPTRVGQTRTSLDSYQWR